MSYRGDMKIFSGSASHALVAKTCENLEMEPGRCDVGRFSDGEVRVQIRENVRGRDVFLVNSTSPPVDDHLMELLIMVDAARRASAERITAVLPYFGYARQDRKDKPRVPITAKLVANLLAASGANRVLTVDLHCGQIQGFFDVPVDHLAAEVVFQQHFNSHYDREKLVVISPDTGSVGRAREFANRLEVPLAIVDKRRPRQNEAEVMNIIGNVDGLHCLIFDDMIDTAGTLVKAANALMDRGAASVRACATHPILSGPALDNIAQSALEEVVVTDSIPLRPEAAAVPKVKALTIAPLLAEAIRRIHKYESVSSLFRS